MEKNYYCAIEINTIYSTALVLAFYNNNLYVVGKSKVLTSGFNNGRIYDELLLRKSITSLLDDLKQKFNINVDETIIILPNNDHKVYKSQFEATIKTEMQRISLNEINNIRKKIVEKFNDKFNDNEALVAEVPFLYTINGMDMRTMPIGMSAPSLIISSNLHTLPKDIVDGIDNFFEKMNIKILNQYINCDCASLAITKQYDLEDEGIIIDINQDVTTIAAYFKSALIKSVKVDFGVKNLVDYLAKILNVSFENALTLFNSYFIADIDLTSDIIFDKEKNLNEKRISGIILNALDNGLEKIADEAYNLRDSLNFSTTCIFYLTGLLNDFEAFTDLFVKQTKINVVINDLNIIGLTNSIYKNCYGALKKFFNENIDFVKNRINVDDEEISLTNHEVINNQNINTKNNINNSTKNHHRFKDIFED